MKMSWLLLLLSLGSANIQAGEAEGFITAEEMASWCQPYKAAVVRDSQVLVNSTSDSQVCFGAFLATQQVSGTLKANQTGTILGVCVPPNVRLTELIKVFLRYSDVHPEFGHDRFFNVVWGSLRKAYPCALGAKSP